MRHAVIMAGGSGTRLWPLSRRMRPKQLLCMFDGQSLLQIARRRLTDLFAPANIWVITSAAYLDQVAEQLPDVPPTNLIGEPVGRDTANAIGLAAGLLAHRDPDATMAVFTADHLIGPQDEFAVAIQAGLTACESSPDSLVTYGISPTAAHTGYGYIRRGELIAPRTYRVAEFKEKPTRAVAETYVQSGEYFWNSGMFAWRAGTLLAELTQHLPGHARELVALSRDWGRLAGTDEARRRFEGLTGISIDYAVMEKARRVLVVQMACEWRDLGSWAAVAGTRTRDQHGNASIAPDVLFVDAAGNIVASESDHLVVLLGVSGLAVLHSDDATLVCSVSDLERIRELVPLREARFGSRFE